MEGPKRRKWPRVLAAIGVAVAILVAVLFLTPFGAARVALLGWSKGLSYSGVELSIGSAGGGLLRGFTFRDVVFTARDGTRFLEADEIGARLSAFSPGSKLIGFEQVHLVGADLLFTPGDGGGAVGWSDFARRGSADTVAAEPGKPWTVALDGLLERVTVDVRRPESGLELTIGPTGGTLSGTIAEFHATLAGSTCVVAPALPEPLEGRFTGSLNMDGSRVLTVSDLRLSTDVGDVQVDGEANLTDRTLDLSVDSSHGIPQLAVLMRTPASASAFAEGSGNLALSSQVHGPFTDLEYSSRLDARDVVVGGAGVRVLAASLEGDATSLSVRSLHVEAFGGALDVTATVGLPVPAAGAGADTAERGSAAGAAESDPAAGDADAGAAVFPTVTAEATFRGIDIARLAELGPGREGDIAGTLDGTANVDWKAKGLSHLNAAFDVSVSGLAAGERRFGQASMAGRLNEGLLLSFGDCCGAELSVVGHVTDEGLSSLELSADAENLAVLGAVLGADELAGNATATVTLSGGLASPTVLATIEAPDLRYRHIQAGPITAQLTGADGAYDVLFDAFGSSLLGRATLEPGGAYEASANARSFDLSRVIPDSLREAMSLAGLVSGGASVTGELGGGFRVTGGVSELDLAARRQHAELVAPFSFTATRDSIQLTEMKLQGTFGELSVAGRYSTSDAIDLDLTFGAAELSEIAELLPRMPEQSPRGQLAGTVQVQGTRASPHLSADIGLRNFEMRGLAIDSARLEATADSSDVVFYVSAESTESGSIWVSGAAPVRPDSTTVWALDPQREFGISLSSEGFILDAGGQILPGVRGEKRFTLTGSALLTGTADSLATITGSGLLSEASASFSLAELALADTVYFEIEGGTLVFDKLQVAVTRRQVLGPPAGGTVTASGAVSVTGETHVSASVADLDVGHMIRALGSAQGARIKGRLNAEASVEGRRGETRGRFSWTVASPVLFDVGFDSASGEGSFESGMLTIERADLRADGSSIGMTGVIAAGARGRAGVEGGAGPAAAGAEHRAAPPRFDLTVNAGGFRLDRLNALPPGVDELSGRLDIDMRVSGSVDSPAVSGTLKLAGGKLRGFGLSSPITGIELDVESSGTSFAVRRAHAKSAGGDIDASAFVEFTGGFRDPTFLVIGDVNSPGFKIEDLGEAKLGGNFSWGGTVSSSELRGKIKVEEAKVTRSFGLGDLMRRSPRVVVIRKTNDPRANVKLNLDLEIEDSIRVESNLAKLSIEGGASVGGTMLTPRLSGSFRASGGTFTYLRNEFTIEELSVDFIEAARRDPYIRLTGVSDVESRTGELYRVTALFNGYANDAVPELSSVPALSEGDIASLLTFGDTFGVIVSGEGVAGSSGDNFSNLARRAFLSNAFGLAEKQLERLLDLDRIDIDEEALTSGNAAEADLMLEKEFGSRLRVNYTTSVGRFSNQRVEVSFEVMRRLWLQTRTNPEGNHAIGVKLQIPFK